MRNTWSYSGLTFALILGSVFLDLVNAEFRFCYKGPQRINELDCPGGFLANEKLKVPCMFYARTKNIPVATAKFTQDVCNPDMAADIDMLNTNEEDILPYGSELQQVLFDIDDNSIMPGDDPGGEMPADQCFSSCLGSWEQPGSVENEPYIADGGSREKEPAQVQRTFNFFQQVLPDMFTDDDEEEEPDTDLESSRITFIKNRKSNPIYNDVDDGETFRIFRLLGKSMRIVLSSCSPYVEQDFLLQVYKGMRAMIKRNESLLVDVSSAEYNSHNHILNMCLQRRNLAFVLKGSTCANTQRVSEIFFIPKKETWSYRRTKRSFRYGIHMPVIEAAWNVVEFVHSYCFDTFAAANLMDLHSYQVAMEGLFPQYILNQWTGQLYFKHPVFWNALLRTTDLNTTMDNLDACIVGSLSMTPFKDRLLRPYIDQEFSQNQQVDEESKAKEVHIRAGWKRSPDAYWEWYENMGGFKKLGQQFGVCLEAVNPDENKNRLEMLQGVYRDKRCPVVPVNVTTGAGLGTI